MIAGGERLSEMTMNKEKMPLQVWILTLAAFAIGTAEFVIAGILPQIATSLSITEGQAGYLISAYALAIVFGGPILTIYLARFNKGGSGEPDGIVYLRECLVSLCP